MSLALVAVLSISLVDSALFTQQYLPVIKQCALAHYRHQNADNRDEAVAEVMTLAWTRYVSAITSGKALADLQAPAEERTGKITPRTIAGFAIAAHDHGRRSYGTSIVDVFAPATRRTGRAHVVGFEDLNDHDHVVWSDYFTAKSGDPSEVVRRRMDWALIAAQCRPKQRRVLELLAEGHSTNEIADIMNCTAGRVSQMKNEIAAVAITLGYAPKTGSEESD